MGADGDDGNARSQDIDNHDIDYVEPKYFSSRTLKVKRKLPPTDHCTEK